MSRHFFIGILTIFSFVFSFSAIAGDANTFEKADSIFVVGKGVFVYPILTTTSNPLGELPVGTKLKILSRKKVDRNKWVLVQPDGIRRGWVLVDAKKVTLTSKFSWKNEPGFSFLVQLRTIDAIEDESVRLIKEKEAIEGMWTELMRLDKKYESKPALSDGAIAWIRGISKDTGFLDMMIERLMKNEGNPEQSRWIAEYIRKLAKYCQKIDPASGENEIRKRNLEIVKEWMDSLYELTFFDNDILVGMYKFKGDREEEKYNQKEKTTEHFNNGIRFYEQGLNRAKSEKARAELQSSIAYLCRRYKSQKRADLKRIYKKGFDHAKTGLDLMENNILKKNSKYYSFEQNNRTLKKDLTKSYTNNYIGYVYNLFLTKDHKTILDIRENVFKIPYSEIYKTDALLLIAESAKELALKYQESNPEREQYAEICLKMGRLAFKTMQKRRNFESPEYFDGDFCKFFNALYTYLDIFEKKNEKNILEKKYGHLCPICKKAQMEKMIFYVISETYRNKYFDPFLSTYFFENAFSPKEDIKLVQTIVQKAKEKTSLEKIEEESHPLAYMKKQNEIIWKKNNEKLEKEGCKGIRFKEYKIIKKNKFFDKWEIMDLCVQYYCKSKNKTYYSPDVSLIKVLDSKRVYFINIGSLTDDKCKF